MAGNLWSSDYTTDKIYRHSGETSTIKTSFSPPGALVIGICWIGSDLWSTSFDSDKIYQHSGGTSTITTSFSTPSSSPHGLAFDGTNLWSSDVGSNKIYQHSGKTSTITTSFSSTSTYCSGLVWIGSDLWSCDTTSDLIYHHSGGTSTITSSFSGPTADIFSITWDGTNLWSCSGNTDKIYKHSGNTSTVTTSFTSPGTTPSGMAWEPAVASTVTTQAATLVKDVTATGNGNITDDGEGAITQHGVCWKLGSDPVNIAGADGSTTEGVGAEGAFTSGMTGLTVSSTYYYRAYATNSVGTSYGAAQTFETLAEIVAPTVTTQAVTEIAFSSATGNGNITATGGDNATRRGFCYVIGVAGDPTTADSVAYDDGDFGTGAYTKAITGLGEETSYRVRAYAVNEKGTSYGVTVQMLTKVAAPTSVAATDGVHTDKVVVTWTKSTGATGYQIYRDGTPLGWLGDVATGDDTGADAPVITPGTAVASDDTYVAYVALSLGGESVADGTTHSYVVRAKTATDESADSSANNGYIGAGSITYQWQRSDADSDASYSNIVAATTDPYNDTGAPEQGEGRYYKCVLDATGSVQATSTADRGYRAYGLMLAYATLAAGAETALSDCAEHTDLSRVTSLSLSVEMTFEAAVDADPTISIFASTENDDDEYDSSAWKTWTFTRSAGNTVILHWPHSDEIRPLPKYIKTKVKNNSGAGANTSITSIKIKKVPLEL